jgi:hypothetical protein
MFLAPLHATINAPRLSVIVAFVFQDAKFTICVLRRGKTPPSRDMHNGNVHLELKIACCHKYILGMPLHQVHDAAKRSSPCL